MNKIIINSRVMLQLALNELKTDSTAFTFKCINNRFYAENTDYPISVETKNDFILVIIRSTLERFVAFLNLLSEQPITISFKDNSELFGITIHEANV